MNSDLQKIKLCIEERMDDMNQVLDYRASDSFSL